MGVYTTTGSVVASLIGGIVAACLTNLYEGCQTYREMNQAARDAETVANQFRANGPPLSPAMREDAQRRSAYFLQPRPEPNRLNPRKAAATRRSLTALRHRLDQAPAAAIRAILLVEARQSSRIESVGGEPEPGGENRPSRLYHALDAAL